MAAPAAPNVVPSATSPYMGAMAAALPRVAPVADDSKEAAAEPTGPRPLDGEAPPALPPMPIGSRTLDLPPRPTGPRTLDVEEAPPHVDARAAARGGTGERRVKRGGVTAVSADAARPR